MLDNLSKVSESSLKLPFGECPWALSENQCSSLKQYCINLSKNLIIRKTTALYRIISIRKNIIFAQTAVNILTSISRTFLFKILEQFFG